MVTLRLLTRQFFPPMLWAFVATLDQLVCSCSCGCRSNAFWWGLQHLLTTQQLRDYSLWVWFLSWCGVGVFVIFALMSWQLDFHSCFKCSLAGVCFWSVLSISYFLHKSGSKISFPSLSLCLSVSGLWFVVAIRVLLLILVSRLVPDPRRS